MIPDIGMRLKAIRQSRGLSQYDLARSAGCHRYQVSRVENGHLPRIPVIARLADALKIPLFYFFYDDVIPKPSYRPEMGFDKKLRLALARISERDREFLYSVAELMARRRNRRS